MLLFTSLVVLAAAALHPWWLPWLVERLALRAIRAAGFPHPSLTVESAGLFRTVVRDLALDPGIPLRARHVEASYTPAGLWHGEIDQLKLAGASLTVARRDGVWDVGNWPVRAKGGEIRLPAKLIMLEYSSVTLDLGDTRLTLPLEGSVAPAETAGFDARVSVVVGASEILVDGHVQPTPELTASLSLSGRGFEVAGIRLQAIDPSAPWCRLSLSNSDSGLKTNIHCSALDLTAATTTIQATTRLKSLDAEFALHPASQDQGLFERLGGTLAIEADDASFDDRRIGSIVLAANVANGTLNGRLDRVGEDWSGTLDSIEVASIQPLLNGSGSTTLEAGWTLHNDPSAPTFAAAGHAKGTIELEEWRSLKGHINLETRGPSHVEGPTWSAYAETASTVADWSWSNGGYTLDGQLMIDGTRFGLDLGVAVELDRVQATVPIHIGPEVEGLQADGPFSIGRINIAGTDIPGARGMLGLDNLTARTRIEWSPWISSPIVADGKIDLSESWPDGFLDIRLQPTDVSLADFPQELTNRLPGITGSATLWLDGAIHLDRGRVAPDITLVIAEGAFRDEPRAIRVDGASLQARLVESWPIRTEGPAEIQIATGAIGTTPIVDADIQFGIEDDIVRVESARWGMGELGRFRTGAFRIDPGDPAIETDIFAEDVGLHAWFNLLAPDKLAGDGRLYGRLTGRFDPGADYPLRFDSGFLYASPEGGWIQFHDRSIAEQTAASIPIDSSYPDVMADIRNRLTDAISNFNFNTLRGDLINDADGITMRVTTSGEGRDQSPAVPIGGLTFILREYDKLLYDLLKVRMSMNRTLNSSLQGFFGDRP